MLMVSCSALSSSTLTRMESGMEIAMISVLFQLPKKSRIMMAVKHAAISPSRNTPWMEARTKRDWSNSMVTCRLSGKEPM